MTTRIRGVVKHAAEFECGLLSHDEAVALLIQTMERDDDDEPTEVPPLAHEVVETCGRLALTVSIAGGMINSYGGLDDELLAEMQRDHKAELRAGTGEDDENEQTVEERIIKASFTALKKDERAGVEGVFVRMAVYRRTFPCLSK